jgi:hypothetical protein
MFPHNKNYARHLHIAEENTQIRLAFKPLIFIIVAYLLLDFYTIQGFSVGPNLNIKLDRLIEGAREDSYPWYS